MTGSRRKMLTLILLCIALSSLWSYEIRCDFQGPMKMPDFSDIYFAARCVLHRKDPYSQRAYFQELKEDNPAYLNDLQSVLKRLKIPAALVYPPTTLLVMAPLAVLPWAIAENVFTIMTAGALALAGFLIWELRREQGCILDGYFIGYFMADCLILLFLGNPAGIAISFCIIAGWCFLEERYALLGVILLALSLTLKPHDCGFVLLYFLLAGGVLRKRALQVFAVVGLMGICAAIWVTPSSPHWFQELRNDVAIVEVPGGSSDPSPTGLTFETQRAPILSIQAAISIFKNDPHFYNWTSWLISGTLILIWAITVLRKRYSREGTLLGLGAVSALTLLPVYHRTYDAKLLLLMIPACGVLWAGKGSRRWISLGLMSAAIFVTSDLANFFWNTVVGRMKAPIGSQSPLEALLLHPAPVVLLAAGCFYLWMYIRYEPPAGDPAPEEFPKIAAAVP